ncbi:hypothetical protein BBAD15_g8238 [Beauveria bassiana D1-5]|uniref:DUF7735 domain-containing protein n=1 Tax=Beauveria bassiana D1-5 TaxID=1245745 RepID=A0A0A2VEZ0_BEABA|nr:hypothetical protein BBAD15_g8238 [Beauveria bassiana D1-5]
MHSQLMLASLLAAVASANNLLTLRQAANPLSSLSKECQADLEEVQSASDLPAIPTAFIGDAFAAVQTLSDACAYTPTGTAAAEYTSFVSAAESWASKHTSIASKIEQDCNAAFQNIANLCPSGVGVSNNKTTSGGGGGGDEAADGATATGDAAQSSGGAGGTTSAAAGKGPAAVGALMLAALGAFALL